jgi:predicted acylesterase/phospholipase RssA
VENVEALPTGDRKEETLLCPYGTAKLSGPVTAKTALVLAGGGITGFLYEVGVLTALDEVAGRAASSEFDAYIGTSAGAVLAALLANGARAGEIFKAIDEEQIGNPFYFQSRDILGVA